MKKLLVMLGFLLFIPKSYGQLLPPHANLPSDEECAKRVVPTGENRPANTQFNDVIPSSSEMAPFYSKPLQFNGPPNSSFFRVDGNFKGTTDEIAQWAACKWGMDPLQLRAQMWAESGWNENVKGDDEFEHELCTGGNGFDAWQDAGYCFTSYSIIQIKCTNYNACPMAYESTPFALDFRGSYWRACMNGEIGYYRDSAVEPGYPKYPNGTTEEMSTGCMGSWYSGNWYDALALPYIDRVKSYMRDKPWEPPVRFVSPSQNATVSGTVKLQIATNNQSNLCFYACVNTDVGFLSCVPGQGPWDWDTTVKVPNGLHVITAITYTCGLASGNDMPTGWPEAHLTLNVQNAARAQTAGKKPSDWWMLRGHHQQGPKQERDYRVKS